MSNFTGYLLPWDQLSFWAVTISAGMLEYIPGIGSRLQRLLLGGSEVCTATLANFYALHTAVLPGLLIGLMPFHFWRVRKAGGLVFPMSLKKETETRKEKVPAIPNLIVRELVVALILAASILMVSALFNAPLAAKANPGLSPNPTKAPWYFMGFQEILLHLHPFVTVFIVPILIVGALVSIPYIPYPSNSAGVWFTSSKGRRTARHAAVTALILAPLCIILDEIIRSTSFSVPNGPWGSLIPFIIIVCVGVGISLFLKRRYRVNQNEFVQMLFVFFLTGFVILTITGIWFRGSGMRLAWPWI